MMQFDIRYFDSVASTMDIAREEAEMGAGEGLVIQAGEQMSGRGRRGNQWTSPTGNLYQSILLQPTVARSEWGQLSFVISVALAKAVRVLSKDTIVNLKWPNDVLLGGQKLAGILIEAADNYVVIGTGVNIEHAPDDRAKIHDFSDISVNDFRNLFLEQIARYFALWQEEGFVPIHDLWLSMAYKKGELIQANLKDRSIAGIFRDIDSQGALTLMSERGEEHIITSSEIINWDV